MTNYSKDLTSPTRKYVAVVEYGQHSPECKEFSLPEEQHNDVNNAAWYYLNHLDNTCLLLFCMSQEVYYNNTKFDISELTIT